MSTALAPSGAAPSSTHKAVDRFSGGLAALPLRETFFAGLVVTGFINGISEKVYRSVSESGAVAALFATFDISIILWGACTIAAWMLVQAPSGQSLGRRDLAVAAFAAICFLLPLPVLGWFGLCVVAAHLYLGAKDAAMRRAAIVVLALTFPLFWARMLFALFMDPILRIDAHLVGWAIGTKAENNVVPYADGSGALFLAPGCSSVANLSLALLSAAVFLNLRGARWTLAAIGWCAASMAAVVGINVLRLALMAVFPAAYDLIHGPVGASVAAWLTLGAIILVGYHRIGCDAWRRA